MKINPAKHSITVDQLKEWVEYDPSSGKMYRIRAVYPKSGRVYSLRKEVVGKNNRGYFWLKVFGHMYLVHRLAFLYMTGKHPECEVDHVNGDRGDNRWVNLVEADAFSNSRNQGIRKDNTSGVRGVTYSRNSDKWVARISHLGSRISLGYFPDKVDAIRARRLAEKQLGYHVNHGRRESWRG